MSRVFFRQALHDVHLLPSVLFHLMGVRVPHPSHLTPISFMRAFNSVPHAGQSTDCFGTASYATSVPMRNKPRPGRNKMIDVHIIIPMTASAPPSMNAIARNPIFGSSNNTLSILFIISNPSQLLSPYCVLSIYLNTNHQSHVSKNNYYWGCIS